MSIQAMAWVLEHSMAEGHDRLVLMAIANHCDAVGRNAWPSTGQIADEARVSRATVFRALSTLQKLGELEVVSGGGRGATNHYRLPLETVSGCDPSTTTKRSQAETEGVSKRRLNGLTGATQTVLNRPEPSRARTRGTSGAVQEWKPTGELEPLSLNEKTKQLERIKSLKGAS